MSKASVYFTVDIGNRHDIKNIKRGLDRLQGVRSVSVNDMTGRVAVDIDTSGLQRERIQRQIEKMGYNASDIKFEDHVM
jgi:copper chaperone CopZ